jgi:UDP-glucose 4-epimerase
VTFGMKYLVTAGAGFIGSHLTERLLNDGHSVTVLDNLSTGQLSNISHLLQNESLKVVEGDIRQKESLEEHIQQADRIFHLAAAVGVLNIVNDPIGSMETNLVGSSNMFSLALKYKKPIFITSSSEIYGKNTSDSLSEDSDRIIGAPQKIRWSYSDSKAIIEAIAVTLFEKHGLETHIVRIFNAVGPRQRGNFGMVLPRFVAAALKNEPIEIYGTGLQTRCFSHVLDVVDGIVKVESCTPAAGRPVNVGVAQEISIVALARKIIELTKSSSEIRFKDYASAYEKGYEDMERRVPNTTLLRSLTGWEPKRDVDKIIIDVAQYLKAL